MNKWTHIPANCLQLNFNWILRPRWRKETVSRPSPQFSLFSRICSLFPLSLFCCFFFPIVAGLPFLHVPLSSFYSLPLSLTRLALQTHRLIIQMLSSLPKHELGRRLYGLQPLPNPDSFKKHSALEAMARIALFVHQFILLFFPPHALPQQRVSKL